MSFAWGYSPKVEKYIPLGDFAGDKYLVICRQAIINLGWNVSYVGHDGLIAYTPVSFGSYSEEITVRIHGNFAYIKSECVGLQNFFTDYGKNEANLNKLFEEFEYVEFHLAAVWDDTLEAFHKDETSQNQNYYERAPLAAKDKIKNVLYLFGFRKGYVITPLLLWLNVMYFFLVLFILKGQSYKANHYSDKVQLITQIQDRYLALGAAVRNSILDGEYWRLLSYQFMHGSYNHLFFNLFALVYFGLMIENKLGWKTFLYVYLAGGICGALLSLSYHNLFKTVGASGSILGLCGALIALCLNKYFEKSANRAILLSALITLCIVFFNGSIGKRTDNMCHLGGFACGLIFTYIFTAQSNFLVKIPGALRYAFTLVVLGLACIGVLGFSTRYQDQEFFEKLKAYKAFKASYKTIKWLPLEKQKYWAKTGFLRAQQNNKLMEAVKNYKLMKFASMDRRLRTEIAVENLKASQLIVQYLETGDPVFKNRAAVKTELVYRLSSSYKDSLDNFRANLRAPKYLFNCCFAKRFTRCISVPFLLAKKVFMVW